MDSWKYSGDFLDFAVNGFFVLVLLEASKTENDEIFNEAFEKIKNIPLGNEAAEAFDRFAWKQFGMTLYQVMSEIRRLVESMSESEWEQIKDGVSRSIEEWEKADQN